MKKLILFVIFFISLKAFAQPSIVYRSNNQVTAFDYNLFAGTSFRVPVFKDTAAANQAYTLDSCGKLIFTYTGNRIWFRACSPKRWIEVGGVTSIAQGYGITNTPNPITGAGSIKVDTATLSTKYVRIIDTASFYQNLQEVTDIGATTNRNIIINNQGLDVRDSASDVVIALGKNYNIQGYGNLPAIHFYDSANDKYFDVYKYNNNLYLETNGESFFTNVYGNKFQSFNVRSGILGFSRLIGDSMSLQKLWQNAPSNYVSDYINLVPIYRNDSSSSTYYYPATIGPTGKDTLATLRDVRAGGGGGGGGGTVTSVASGYGLLGGPITTTGTLRVDTTTLNTKYLKIADTSSMLSPYLRKVDTASLSNRINLKLNISDTASMLSPYLRKVDTASLSNRINLRVKYTDTASMLAPYLRKIDTASLSNRINLKLNISDTASMLSPYLRKVDTASLSNRINLKLNISDTSSMLSPYLRKIDTTGKWVNNIYRTPGKDSIYFTIGSTTKAIKDSIGSGTVTSVGLSMPSAFTVSNSPVTSSGTISVAGAGLSSQYIRGDGVLANFPVNPGGGSAVNYFFNGSVNQGTFGGNTYYQMSKTAISGAAANFTIGADGYIANFITDAGDPNLLNIPAGNWDFQIYFSASSSGGAPQFYLELYKYNGGGFTLISSGSTSPQNITNGTFADVYAATLSVPATTLSLTDRLAVRVYIIHSGRTITMYTQDNKLAEVHTTFSTGIAAINGLTAQIQYLATGTSGTDFNISSSTDTHIFNLPVASATNTGKLSSSNWSTFNGKIGPGDTASMLSPYLRKVDTASLSNRINLRVKYTDTASMLSPYLRKIDTASLSNRINLKLNISDTASMLTPYARKNQYVPYTGAAQDLFMPNRTISSFQLNLNEQGLSGDTAFISYYNQGFRVDNTFGQLFYADPSTYALKWKAQPNFPIYAELNTQFLSANRQYFLPDYQGTIALIEDTVATLATKSNVDSVKPGSGYGIDLSGSDYNVTKFGVYTVTTASNTYVINLPTPSAVAGYTFVVNNKDAGTKVYFNTSIELGSGGSTQNFVSLSSSLVFYSDGNAYIGGHEY